MCLWQKTLYNIVNLTVANAQNEKIKTCTLKVHTYHSHILGHTYGILLILLNYVHVFSDIVTRDTDNKMLTCSTIFSYVDIIMPTVEVIIRM